MILSGRDIQLYIETGELRIYPVVQEQFRQNGIDLILDQVRRPHDEEEARYKGTIGRHYPVFTPRFYLGSTAETLELPNDLMAFVQLRSTWARQGLLLPPTIVDAGFKGNLTLEIVCAADSCPVPYGQRFAHLVFARCTGPCVPYDGKYQNQTGVTFSKKDR
jgi:dCTP deaminase